MEACKPLRDGLGLSGAPPPRHSQFPDTDSASCANINEVRTLHAQFHWRVDFAARAVSGYVEHQMDCRADCNDVLFDVFSMDVHKVEEVGCDTALTHSVEEFASYGSRLRVKRKCTAGNPFKLRVHYTAGSGPACTWLDPPQTAMKEKPYLFTQGQACLNRSLFPCQDTPAVKFTYDADVYVPEGFVACMSAREVGEPTVQEIELGSEKRLHKKCSFKMNVRIPSYLVALVAADLVSAEIGPRSKVWSERSVIERARAEFDGVVEEYLSVAENLFGPYIWERYDILIMPPSFPFGGMENPMLTFVTPTLLVGDRSLADVVMHEIAHSWFGNLVTNKNWSDFWLNEGFTMYAQRRICTVLLGEAYTCLECATGRAILLQDIEEFGEKSPLTRLHVPIEEGVDPEDTYNETPYEKGFAFVSYLRSVVGSDERFDKFLEAYATHYAQQSIQYQDFFALFTYYFSDLKHLERRGDGLDFESWMHQPGLPPFFPDISAGESLMAPARELADKLTDITVSEIGTDAVEGWCCQQLCYLLNILLERDITPERLAFIDERCSFSSTRNPEVRLRWSQLTVKGRYDADLVNIRRFLEEQGKQKYTVPVYRALVRGSEQAVAMARSVFDATKDGLHPNVRKYVSKALKE